MGPAVKPRSRLAWNQVADGSRFALHHTSWWRHIYRDYRRYAMTGEPFLRTVFLSQGFWASCVYRLSRAMVHGAKPAFLRPLLRPVAALLQKLTEIVTGISLPADCEIGEGFYIGHFGGIVLSPRVRIGHNCSIAQNVTLGSVGAEATAGAPTIGNRVFLGAHSVVVGDITIGDDAMICAGSMVNRSVPARAVVLGNPARVISYEGSFGHVNYDGMEADAARRRSAEAEADEPA
ncbi:MAG TPA: DapH/DapD/GlmU-related protein [Burkholderiales bacterium]